MEGYVGFYRDDGLGAIVSISGRLLDQLRKCILKIFETEGLSITIEINLRQTDFLDVMLDLDSGKYSPFRKPNNEPLYINAKSNHPPSILKELPQMINRRISDLSCNEEEFNKAKGQYEASLSNSGHESTLKYDVRRTPRRNRNRKVIWFNPPFNSCVRTNVGKQFLKLIKKHFTVNHRFYKIFNKNTIKLSYSCMPSVGSAIKQHNNKLLNPTNTDTLPCNCQDKTKCPVPDACRTKTVVYTAVVTAEDTERVYHGSTEGEVKARISGHETSFRHRRYEHETTLSQYIWQLKDRDSDYQIKWSIELKAHPYTCGARRCDLCLSEKMVIARSRHGGLLNARSELMSKCRHRNKFTLANVT